MGKILNIPHWHGGYTGDPSALQPDACPRPKFDLENYLLLFSNDDDYTFSVGPAIARFINNTSEVYTFDLYYGAPTPLASATITEIYGSSMTLDGAPVTPAPGFGQSSKITISVAPASTIVLSADIFWEFNDQPEFGSYWVPDLTGWHWEGPAAVATLYVGWSCGSSFGSDLLHATVLVRRWNA